MADDYLERTGADPPDPEIFAMAREERISELLAAARLEPVGMGRERSRC